MLTPQSCSIPVSASFPEHRCVLTPTVLEGARVRLEPASLAHAKDLFTLAHADLAAAQEIFRYMPMGPFENVSEFSALLQQLISVSETVLPFVIIDKGSGGKVAGSVCFLQICPEHRRLEVGSIWLGPQFQRTYVGTEANYLLLKHAFDHLKMHRVEWKCDSLNSRSRAAAERLGYTYEGRFRNHMVIRKRGAPDRTRHTDYLSIVNEEWPTVEKSLLNKLARPL